MAGPYGHADHADLECTDLAVVVGARRCPAINRLYLSSSKVVDCDVTAWPRQDRVSQFWAARASGKLAINSSRTRLFGARADDNAVAVLKLTTHTLEENLHRHIC
jgi:hypothetical protein